MYLEYADYVEMGGILDEDVYNSLERKARYLINSQASGRCGDRIAELSALPDCIKDCVFELISFVDANDTNKQVASESQSQGGVSESLSYVTRTDTEIEKQEESIIHEFLHGGGCGHLLYKGACL